MKISFIGTYPPRRCGIGTFTNNLVKHIYPPQKSEDLLADVDVIAINNNISIEDYPPEVKLTIDQETQHDYYKAGSLGQ